MPEQLWFTEILNHLFAGPVTGLLRALHIEPHHPQAPITNAVAMQFLVFGVMFVSALFRPLLPYVNLVTILATLVPITFAWAQTSTLSPHGLLMTSAIEMACGLALTAWGSSAWRRADLA